MVTKHVASIRRAVRFKGQDYYIEVSGHGKLWFETMEQAKKAKEEQQELFPDLLVDGPYKHEPDPFKTDRKSNTGAVCSNCGKSVSSSEISQGESVCCHADVVDESEYGQNVEDSLIDDDDDGIDMPYDYFTAPPRNSSRQANSPSELNQLNEGVDDPSEEGGVSVVEQQDGFIVRIHGLYHGSTETVEFKRSGDKWQVVSVDGGGEDPSVFGDSEGDLYTLDQIHKDISDVINYYRPKKQASRKAGLGKDFVAFINGVLKDPQNQMVHKVNRFQQRYGNNYDEMGKAILIEMGGELNMLSLKNNSTAAAINMVAHKYGMESSLIKNLFYSTGAPFQYSGAQFEMLKIKESKAAVLRKLLQKLRSKDIVWDTAKGELLHEAANLKISLEDRRSIQDAIESSSNYERAESALVYMEMKHQGMPAELPTRSKVASLLIAYRIPWEEKVAIKAAQLASRNHCGVRIKSSKDGLIVRTSIVGAIKTGLAKRVVTSSMISARSTGQYLSGDYYQHLDGSITADIHMAVSADEAKRMSSSMIADSGVAQAVVWDLSGTPHYRKK